MEEEMRESGAGGPSSVVESSPAPPLYTRIRFAMFLLVSFLICLLAKDGLRGAFEWLPVLKSGCTSTVRAESSDSADGFLSKEVSTVCTGYEVVFRLSFTCAIFFMLHAMVQIRECCCVSEEQKNDFQSGYFCIKTLLFLVLLVGTVFIPNGFFAVYAQCCVVGSGMFLILQVILIIDFVYGWNDSWAQKAEDEPRWGWYLIILTCFFYIVGLALVIVMYVEFTAGDSCDRNGIFITATLVLCVLYTGLSVRMPHGSIFVASLVFVYTTVICFSAIKNGDDDRSCNHLATDSTEGLSWTIVLSSLFVGVSVAWASVSAGSQRKAMSLSDPEDNDEHAAQSRNYLFFHCVMVLGSMYMAMILTSWKLQPGDMDDGQVNHGATTMWVQIGSQWLATAAFIWSLLAPVCMKDRDFEFV
ncbi:putative serine incorporator [Diplonema papillatum]|nr:putative serine incorporator [Diplonema papillatum]